VAQVPLRILVADDDRDTAVMLATILRHEGHEVHVVLRGDEVLELERLAKPDVLVIDIHMPGMSGYAVAREIRERRPVHPPLLVAVSGVWTKKSEQLLGQAIGFDHYLLKPCAPQEVVTLIDTFASTRRPPGGATQ
jgi:DNA-binding response OmpR family regulator